ncbi:MAG: alpha/beta hydrolase [Oscillospiraceae bacterium]|nr:alpha/beta hydrolase [Oscillospiraceae bacterium]
MASSIRKTAAILGGAAALGALSLYLPYRIAFRSPQKGQNDIYRLPPGEQYEPRAEEMRGMIRRMAAEPCERVSITSRDGLKLRGRLYLRGGPEAPVDLCFHGWRATGLRDFSGGGLFLLGEGHNVLLVDQRAQGDSEGKTMTFGVLERWDCLDWLAYIQTKPELRGPVTLYGVSMGAVTVLLASALPLPGNVRCIIADSPYSSPEAILEKVSRDMGLPGKPAMAALRFGAALFGGFSFDGASCMEAVKHTRVPILLIHGEEDRFVPLEMSREIAAANPEKVRLVAFPGAGHGLSYLTDTERYRYEVSEFCRRTQKTDSAS